MIEVQGVSKSYGATVAVDNLSFAVQPGRVTGFLGPNGSGKSTTMRMMLGLDRPATGQVLIDGKRYPTLHHPLRAVGALLEAKSVHPGRKAYHHLRWVAASNGIPTRRVREVLDLVGLSAVAAKRAGGFSLGMSQRLGLATALLGDPPILLLDEPVNGLDPEGILWIRQFMKTYAGQGKTVFVSSHLLSEMAVTADHLVIIGRGRLIADVPTKDFLDRSAQAFVRVRGPEPDKLAAVLSDRGLAVLREPDGALAVRGAETPAVGEAVGAAGLVLHELSSQRPSLEDAFLAVTRGAQEFSGGMPGQPGPPPGWGAPPPGYAAPPGYAPAPAGIPATRTGIPAGSGLGRSAGAGPEPAHERDFGAAGPGGGTVINAVRAEQIKLTTLRSTWWSIGFVVAVSLGVGLLIAGVVDGSPPDRPADTPGVLFLAASLVALVGVMAMAVITATGEYRFGQIRLSLTAVPHRWQVVLAKAFVTVLTAFVVGTVTAWATIFLAGPLLPSDWKIDLGGPDVQRVIWGLPLLFSVAALLALSLGLLLRNSPAAITILAVLSLVVEKTLLGIEKTQDWAAYLPFNAGFRITQPDDGDPILLAPWDGYLLFLAYAGLLFLIALIVVERRDA